VEELLHVWQNRRILVLGLARPEVHARFPRLWQKSGLQEIGLKGLTLRAGERLVRAVLGPDQLASERRIVELADGNAFYLEELIRRAAEGRTDFPETVLAMVQSRIEALAVEERRILRAASVLGETFWAGCVDVLLATSNAAEWLDSLVELELLVPRAQARFPGEREYVFRHALLRDAAYGMLSEADKSVAHGMAGSWLERAGETDARLLAGHYERGGLPHRAITWIARAALLAVDAGDIEEACALSERGLALGATGSERGMLLLIDEYMAAWNRRTDPERLREAISLLPQASAHWWLGIATSIFSASSTGDAQVAEPFLELAMTSDPGNDRTGFRGLALQSLASGTILMGRPDIGWSLLECFEHKGLDDSSCDPLFTARLQIARSHLAVYSQIEGKWQLQVALDWARESTAVLDAAGSASGEMTANFILGCAWLFIGVYHQAESTLRKSRGHAKEKGNLLVEHYSQLVLAWAILRLDRVDEALALLRPLAGSWDPNIVHGARAVEAEACFQAGRVEDALRQGLTATSGPAVPYRRMAWTTVARAQLALDDPTGALESVASAANDGNASANLEFEVDLRVTEARALLQLGRVTQARAVLSAAEALLRDVAAGISDRELRHAFLYEVRAHAQLDALVQAQSRFDMPAR
jgi:tetratricopeptide (TPR) repeat protein